MLPTRNRNASLETLNAPDIIVGFGFITDLQEMIETECLGHCDGRVLGSSGLPLVTHAFSQYSYLLDLQFSQHRQPMCM